MRPKGWEGYHCGRDCLKCFTNPVDCNEVFEAGADAMLEGLKKDGWRCNGESAMLAVGDSLDIRFEDDLKGYLVFIEDD